MLEKDFKRLNRFYKLVMPGFKIVSKQMQQDYRNAFPLLLSRVPVTGDTTVLDIGTGTGGLAGLFLEYTPHITGVDMSPDMLREAEKRYGGQIRFLQMAAHELGQFKDGEFDLVTAAYSLHDMNNEYRLQVLAEMCRVARHKVVIFDFVKNYNPFIAVVEFFEGSYYWDFVNTIDSQLAQVFTGFEKIKVLNRMGLYICDVR